MSVRGVSKKPKILSGERKRVFLLMESVQIYPRGFFHRVQRRCVCRQNIKTRRKPLKKWVIFIALQFRYTFYRPQTKRLRARKIGLQYKIRKGWKQIWGRFSNPWHWVERTYKTTVISRLCRSSVVPTILPLASLAMRFATTGKPSHKQNLLKTSKTVDTYNKCPVLKDLSN